MGRARELAEVATAYDSGGLNFRNRIINGDMRIDQRNAGASVTVNQSALFYGVDRWGAGGVTSDGVFTIQRDTSAPSGFSNSTKVTTTTADTSIGANQTYNFQQRIEGLNVADLGWGTAGAQTVTLSFWVRSSLTGTFGGSILNSAQNYSYPFSYSISAADTWEQKSITISGPTSGTWLTDNGTGITVMFSIGAGSSVSGTAGAWSASGLYSATGAVNLISTNGATFYITGVQLEAGSVATPFERRDYGRELMMCQRYYQSFVARASGGAQTTTQGFFHVPLKVTMRASPTVTGSGNFIVDDYYQTTATTASFGSATSNADLAVVNIVGCSPAFASTQRPLQIPNANTGVVMFSAEL